MEHSDPVVPPHIVRAIGLVIREVIPTLADDFGLGDKATRLRALDPIRTEGDLHAAARDVTRILAYGKSRYDMSPQRNGSGHHDEAGIDSTVGSHRHRAYAFSHLGIPVLDMIDFTPRTDAAFLEAMVELDYQHVHAGRYEDRADMQRDPDAARKQGLRLLAGPISTTARPAGPLRAALRRPASSMRVLVQNLRRPRAGGHTL